MNSLYCGKLFATISHLLDITFVFPGEDSAVHATLVQHQENPDSSAISHRLVNITQMYLLCL